MPEAPVVASRAPIARAARPSIAPSYTALIRTRDSFPIVADVIAALRAQTAPPDRIVVVDHASRADQRQALEALVDEVVDYPDEPFNYSHAINLGVARCRTEHVLVISSHVTLDAPDLVAKAAAEAWASGTIGFYFWNDPDCAWRTTVVGRRNFDGRNGLHNTCAFLRTADLVARPFRPEVFSAEDQEWAAHQFRAHDATLLQVRTRAMNNRNPRNDNVVKFINEEVSIAYFTCPEKLGVAHLASWLGRSLLAFGRGRRARARAHFKIFRELVLARVRPPRRTSSYY